MHNHAKVRLSALEAELVNNSDWILTKNRIIEKVKEMLGEIQLTQQGIVSTYSKRLPLEAINPPPKISKGENYRGLPYLVLDYPRYFNKPNIFAVRTMFWWGNFFSITLHVSGIYKEILSRKIFAGNKRIKKAALYYCVNEAEWEHHFEPTNYKPFDELSETDLKEYSKTTSFIKLAQKVPLSQWDNAEELLANYFQEMIELMAD